MKGVKTALEKIKRSFLNGYYLFEKACSEKFGIEGADSEYINRLKRAWRREGIEGIVLDLIRCKGIKERACLAGAEADISESDAKWIRKFARAIKSKKDPITKYLAGKN